MPKPPAKFFKEEHLNRLVAGKRGPHAPIKPMTEAERQVHNVFLEHADVIGKATVSKSYMDGRFDAMVEMGFPRDAARKGFRKFVERHFAAIAAREAPELITGRPNSKRLAELLKKHGANEVIEPGELPEFKRLVANTLRSGYLDALHSTISRLPSSGLKIDAPAREIASKLVATYQKKAPHNVRADIMLVDVLRKYKLFPAYAVGRSTTLYVMPTPTKEGIEFLSSELKARGLNAGEINHALRLVRHPSEWA